MRHIRQPLDGLCGQACVAMAADVSLERAVDAVGISDPAKGTCTKDVVRGLTVLGIRCANRLRPIRRAVPILPPRCMVAMKLVKPAENKVLWHWILMWDGQKYDPSDWGDFTGWRMTSYLEILS